MSDKVKVSCPYCGTTNNFPMEALGKRVVCGRCRSSLPEPGTVVELHPEGITNLVQRSLLPVLFDFYSPTCAPCHMMNPVVENLARRRAGEIMVAKVNVDQNPQVAAGLGIQGVPTFVVFSRGTEMGRTSGAISETDFALWVASVLSRK